MLSFEELFGMYINGDESIYDCLCLDDFDYLYDICDHDLSKYYSFKCWLESIEVYY